MALFGIFKKAVLSLDTLEKISSRKDPDNSHNGSWAVRQGKSEYWDVYKSHKELSLSGFETTFKERVVSGVSLREAVDAVERGEQPWEPRVRGLEKPFNHYLNVRALLPPLEKAEIVQDLPPDAKLLRQADALAAGARKVFPASDTALASDAPNNPAPATGAFRL